MANQENLVVKQRTCVSLCGASAVTTTLPSLSRLVSVSHLYALSVPSVCFSVSDCMVRRCGARACQHASPRHHEPLLFTSPLCPPHASHQDAAGAMDDHKNPGVLAGAVKNSLIGELFLGEKDTTLEVLEPVHVGGSILLHRRVRWVHQ